MDVSAARLAGDGDKAAGMRPVVRFHEGSAFSRREVADFEDRRHMTRRHRNGIGRIGDLGDEAAVALQSIRQPLARACGRLSSTS